MLDRRAFDVEAVRVAFHEGVEAGDVGRIRRDAMGLLPGEHLVVKEIVERFIGASIGHVGTQQSDTPGTAFASVFHHRYRDVDRRCHDLLPDIARLEETAVAEDLIDVDRLFLEQDVQASTQRTQRGKELHAHEVGEVEVAVRRAHEHRTAFFEVRHVLARNVAVSEQAAGVRITSERQIEQRLVQLRLVGRHAEGLEEFVEHGDPGVEFRRAVVRVRHGHQLAVRPS